jgi:hypothetical protein
MSEKAVAWLIGVTGTFSTVRYFVIMQKEVGTLRRAVRSALQNPGRGAVVDTYPVPGTTASVVVVCDL